MNLHAVIRTFEKRKAPSKHSKRFHQVFRGKITNTEVESTVGKKRYFMGVALMCKGSSFGRVARRSP